MIKNIPTNDPNKHLHDIIIGTARYLIKESPALANDPNLYALISHWLENRSLAITSYSTATLKQFQEALESTEAQLGLSSAKTLQNVPLKPIREPAFTFIDL